MELNGRLRKTPRQARSRDTVDAILAAAERVLRSHGYGAASTNRMARVAGFSVGSLYQYFDDKQAVVGALVDQALRAEAVRLAALLDEVARSDGGSACDVALRALLAERRAKAHLLRVLDAHAPELSAEPPLRHVLRVQAAALAEPLQRLAAAHFADGFRGAFDEHVAVAVRFVNALGYALAVDAPERTDDDAVARHALATLAAFARPSAPRAPTAGGLREAWRRADGAFGDAAARGRRLRATRAALVDASFPGALEPAAFVPAAVGEACAQLEAAPRFEAARAEAACARLVSAGLEAAAR